MQASIKACEKALIEASSELIKIKSVKEDPKPGMPFGPGPAAALKYVLDLAADFGFETKNLDNYAGWAQWGQGQEMVGVLVHLDVVPEGSGWTYPPYGGKIVDGKLYGRGAIDNKGPAMAALFALKALKDSGIKCKRRVRVIFGTDEESGFECMEYYKKHDEIPTMGFSPDAQFPIINSEKGILTFKFKANFPPGPASGIEIRSFEGGHRSNMVPDFAKVRLVGDAKEISEAIEILKASGTELGFEETDEGMVIRSFGISAHGSTPDQGKNAIMQLISPLTGLDLVPSQQEIISFLEERIGNDTTGSKLGVALADEISGDLTFNVGLAHMDSQKASITVNIRYPISYDGEDILRKIREGTPENISVDLISDNKPHHVPEDNLMIQKLKIAYKEVTGDQAHCFSIGGGTYARLFDNCVAFGPAFPGDPELAHQKDEYIEVEKLIKNLHIYAKVLEQLVRN